VKALIARGVGRDLTVEDVQLPATLAGQVRVRVRAAGVCHSDLSMVNGTVEPPYPLVLGHEAAGVVTEVGTGVERVAVGDHVVLNWSPACHECWYCRKGEPWLCETSGIAAVPGGFAADGTQVNVTLGLGALAQEVVVADTAVIAVPRDLPFEQAALLGCCAVLTGVGAVRNTAGVAAGDSVLVIGLGGVGLSAVAVAAACGRCRALATRGLVRQPDTRLACPQGRGERLVVQAALGRRRRVGRLPGGTLHLGSRPVGPQHPLLPGPAQHRLLLTRVTPRVPAVAARQDVAQLVGGQFAALVRLGCGVAQVPLVGGEVAGRAGDGRGRERGRERHAARPGVRGFVGLPRRLPRLVCQHPLVVPALGGHRRPAGGHRHFLGVPAELGDPRGQPFAAHSRLRRAACQLTQTAARVGR
jgi:hypothetical protein